MMGESGTGTLDNSGGGADSTVPTDEAGGATGFDFDSQQEPLFGQA